MRAPYGHEIRPLTPDLMDRSCERRDCGEDAFWETSYKYRDADESQSPVADAFAKVMPAERLVTEYTCDRHAREFGQSWGLEFPPNIEPAWPDQACGVPGMP